MIKKNEACRECGGTNLIKVIALGDQALANSFIRAEDIEAEHKFPLDVYFCADCHLAQLIDVVDKEVMFRDYVYFSSGMPKLSDHFLKYANDVMERFLSPGDFVFEIASNDGILLKHFSDKGYKVLGIDPALNVVAIAEKMGVRTLPEFFSEDIAKEIAQTEGKAKAILANNVFAHVDDHPDLVRGVKALLHPDGVFVIEAPYLVDMFENLAFDTIYHEHLNYLAVRPLVTFFKKYDLELFDVKVVQAQGNSLRLFIGHPGAHKVTDTVSFYIQKELTLGMDKVEAYLKLSDRIEGLKRELTALLKDLKKKGKTIAGYGAPAKGNTLLHYMGIGPETLDYLTEALPTKIGLLSPGMHIPVIDINEARKNPPDYFVMLAWNYRDAIMKKEEEYMRKGGKFIIPIGNQIDIV